MPGTHFFAREGTDRAALPCGHVLCVRCSLTAVANGACFTCTAPIEKLPKEIPIQLYI